MNNKLKFNEIKGVNVRYYLIKDKSITLSESVFLSLLLDIDLSNGIPSNIKISNIIGIKKSAVSRMINNLIKIGYLKKDNNKTDKQAFEYLSAGTTHIDGCLFCGYKKTTLDEHHYPIRAKDGGANTISICPNCHRLFHELTDYNRNIRVSSFILEKDCE